jgi:large subunit ribosomal protein L13
VSDTYFPKPADLTRKWLVINAEGKPLGRLASVAAAILRGKHKPIFTPFVDTGDHVIIINAEKAVLTGNKLDTKKRTRWTGYPGGLRVVTYRTLMKVRPERAVELAVKGMLPHNRLGRSMFGKLKVYRGPAHPHQAQKPENLEIEI